MLDALLDGVVVVDSSGAVERMNSEACRILETSSESVRARPVAELLGAEHALARLARSVLESGGSAAWSECPVERRLDVDLLVDVAASPLFDAAGRLDGAVLVMRDRTLESSLRDLVSEREELASFGRIASGIAHEVKNPLGGIRGAGEILAARAGDGRTARAAELIVREVDRITALIDDLLVFSRGDQLQLDAVNLHRVLDGVLDLLMLDPVSARSTVERAFDPSIPEFLADRDRLNQVFLNLARNALQAMEEKGGTLTITTRMQLDPRQSLLDGARMPSVSVTLADTGPGVSPEVLERLGTPFFTTRPGGTGLGIAVARHWIARHGGALRVESTLGEGTCVRTTLPLRRPR